MSQIDWIILFAVLFGIVAYGTWVSRGANSMKSYFLGDSEANWWTIGLSVMATQASAITFLSTPGQAYYDGMGFIQFYFGLPIAMIIICIYFIPIYKRLKVVTAYEYLESRFDRKTRTLTSFLFLVQRGLAAGITIFAPAIILSTVLNWNLKITILLIGILVIVYTLIGGTKAVSITHKQQMAVIFLGLFAAFYVILSKLPDNIGLMQSLEIAGAANKLELLDFSFDLENRYTFWSGIIGGTFLALSYFGTDQSQVQRYLSGKSIKESQMGLIMNGFLKIPMQFFILLLGVMVFVFFQFNSSPIFFNASEIDNIKDPSIAQQIKINQDSLDRLHKNRLAVLQSFTPNSAPSNKSKNMVMQYTALEKQLRTETKEIIKQANPDAETNDKDYVFIYFILNHLPKGLIGLLLAVIFSAAMSSTASEINALASTTTVDIYKRSINPNGSESHYLFASKAFTLMWGVIAILFASFGSLFENLIQFVNIIGSIFYGTILGIFLVAFFIKSIGKNAIFYSALIAETLVIAIYLMDIVPFLWLNLIGAVATVIFALILQLSFSLKTR